MDVGALSDGLLVAVVGFTVVMIALFILYMIMIGFSKVLNPEEKKLSGGSGNPSGASNSTHKQKEVQQNGTNSIDSNKLAAIAAAVSAAMVKGSGDFQITGIRPIKQSAASPWKLAGRNMASPLIRR